MKFTVFLLSLLILTKPAFAQEGSPVQLLGKIGANFECVDEADKPVLSVESHVEQRCTRVRCDHDVFTTLTWSGGDTVAVSAHQLESYQSESFGRVHSSIKTSYTNWFSPLGKINFDLQVTQVSSYSAFPKSTRCYGGCGRSYISKAVLMKSDTAPQMLKCQGVL